MNKRVNVTNIFLSLLLAATLSGCSKVSLGSITGGKSHGGGSTSGSTGGAGEKGSTGGEQANPPAPAANASLDGYWKIAFKFGDKVGKSSVQMHQDGGKISGSGTDDDTSKAFNISGTIDGQHVQFVKQYETDNPSQQGPGVQYDGKLEMVKDADYQGPYLSGQYTAQVKGQPVSDNWEAQMTTSQGGGGETASGQQGGGGEQSGGGQGSGEGNAPAGQAPQPDKAPDLSGKWKVAYEFDFKTIKSTMFLEQDKDRLTGRGIDVNTNEKFEIAKGWYAYPKVTIERTYKKGKGGAASDRVVKFKGKVEWVNDKDYSGPYMRGKTELGGDWEAQLVR